MLQGDIIKVASNKKGLDNQPSLHLNYLIICLYTNWRILIRI